MVGVLEIYIKMVLVLKNDARKCEKIPELNYSFNVNCNGMVNFINH